jgi:hypothetical protein
MPTINFAWQLGSGLGHLMRLLPLARGVAASGQNRVYLAFRHLTRAATIYGRVAANFLQAPAKAEGKLFAPMGSHYALQAYTPRFDRISTTVLLPCSRPEAWSATAADRCAESSLGMALPARLT